MDNFAGANFNTASPSWGNYSSANLLGGHVTNTLVTTNNATWQLTGVQLEVGSVATDFEHRSMHTETLLLSVISIILELLLQLELLLLIC